MRLLFLLMLIPLNYLLCQDSDSTRQGKFLVGLTFSPDYCYRTLKADSSLQWIVELRDNAETPRWGYTTGLNFGWKISKSVIIEAGILYSDKGEQSKNIPVVSFDGNPDEALTATIIRHYIYLDIPLKANYNIMNKRVKLFFSGGVSPNIFVSERTTVFINYADGHTEKHHSTSNSGMSRVNLTLISGFGASFDINSKLSVKAEAMCRHSVTSIIDAPIKSYLFSAGLNTGIYYKF